MPPRATRATSPSRATRANDAMPSAAIVELIGAIVALILAAVELVRSRGESLTAWAVLVLAVVIGYIGLR